MHFELTYRQTWLHALHPVFKFVMVIVLFVAILFIHNPNFLFYMLIGFGFLYIGWTGHSFKLISILSSPFLIIFVSSATSMMFFGDGTNTWYKIGLIHITEESFYRGVHLGLRGILFGLLGLLFALTTRPVLLFYSAMQTLKLKPKYAYAFMAAINLLPIMVSEFQTLRNALKVRGVTYNSGIKGVYQRIQYFSIPLLAQSIRRAHRTAIAMEAKQFSNDRTYYYQVSYSLKDLYFTFLILAIMATSFWVSTIYSVFPIDNVRMR
ncbi:transmembrane component YkoC of energizing module of thiamin-regulated ECF transporter for HydroxyMethylPyrimidine [Gracilibacillus boraciitolerans JCM 21714]|uniref:Transmembrane component YkoC of energizing module of thiamin-regulated ECF transporter for HydroxyMethylPyrimidine n=1 Tax=Gracilibacillus boraciitolerans JCM 21714 TaxID=1298598 RepID=W4VF66_9BACI|nr:energy-coupling factor transporter transmembrane component T [Gracilibacillus boraciitolerans]GAE91438.1 transmembrane component YkoC of energizing module of thiamin-regulated ECF transporter for HydroxyMethylPyrimidine [Gracilibacillus boraciitolerans JCM 21714]